MKRKRENNKLVAKVIINNITLNLEVDRKITKCVMKEVIKMIPLL